MRETHQKTIPLQDVKRKKLPTLPPASNEHFRPEPAIDSEHYEFVLTVIENMTAVMEQHPAAFSSINEEALRSHFLVQLNGHFEGRATGETFNFEGKTDIIIKEGGKNVFIAECKFWHGPKGLQDAIDQLLGYSSWRDTKTAIIVFNRRGDLTKVLEQIPGVVASHPNCKRFVKRRSETSFQFAFSHKDDPSRELTLTVLVFEVPHGGPT